MSSIAAPYYSAVNLPSIRSLTRNVHLTQVEAKENEYEINKKSVLDALNSLGVCLNEATDAACRKGEKTAAMVIFVRSPVVRQACEKLKAMLTLEDYEFEMNEKDSVMWILTVQISNV